MLAEKYFSKIILGTEKKLGFEIYWRLKNAVSEKFVRPKNTDQKEKKCMKSCGLKINHVPKYLGSKKILG